MLQLKEQTVMVWEPKESEKMNRTWEANISSSKKKSDGERSYMSWNGRLVGKAYEKAKELKSQDVIKITQGAVENFFRKENEKLYVTVVIFDYEKVEK